MSYYFHHYEQVCKDLAFLYRKIYGNKPLNYQIFCIQLFTMVDIIVKFSKFHLDYKEDFFSEKEGSNYTLRNGCAYILWGTTESMLYESPLFKDVYDCVTTFLC